ncbi:MAG: anti-sigma F factor antagonist [Anaerotignum sp.]|nr:anti-sigma F factor antagonist [Anaerotignum sp.]
MEVYFKKKNKTLIIKIHGEIDHHTVKELRRQIENAFIQMGGRNIIFDYNDVSFMDSSGIGMLIGRYKELQVFGGRIALICVNEKIKELLKLSGLSKVITCFETLEDALNYTEGRENHAV